MRPRKRIIAILLALLVIPAALTLLVDETNARSTQPSEAQADVFAGVDNETCLACHAPPSTQITLPSGEPLYLGVDRDTYNQSVHGEKGYACVQCHTEITDFPHPPLDAATRRDVTLEMNESCGRCHAGMSEATQDSVHQQALQAGNKEAAVCSDCHGAHNVQASAQTRTAIPQTCERCHSQIVSLYRESVHGSALIGEGNPDVPTCIDCHGVHDVRGPSTSPFHLFSPQICAECHADQELMDKYGISTDVFDTYVSDFHGTTVVLFQEVAPGQETNKPVCIDCHSVHDIRKVDDPESTVIKENLLATCQKCHPDAQANFPAAWLSHYQPSPEHHPAVYYVGLFYKILIPTLIGGMLAFVTIDASRRFLGRRKEALHE